MTANEARAFLRGVGLIPTRTPLLPIPRVSAMSGGFARLSAWGYSTNHATRRLARKALTYGYRNHA